MLKRTFGTKFTFWKSYFVQKFLFEENAFTKKVAYVRVYYEKMSDQKSEIFLHIWTFFPQLRPVILELRAKNIWKLCNFNVSLVNSLNGSPEQ